MATKRTFSIPVIWTMTGYVRVQAENLEDAIDATMEAPLPLDGDYLEDSFEIDYSEISHFNTLTPDEKEQVTKEMYGR